MKLSTVPLPDFLKHWLTPLRFLYKELTFLYLIILCKHLSVYSEFCSLFGWIGCSVLKNALKKKDWREKLILEAPGCRSFHVCLNLSACSKVSGCWHPRTPSAKLWRQNWKSMSLWKLWLIFQVVTRASVLQSCQIPYVQKPCHLNFKVRAIF